MSIRVLRYNEVSNRYSKGAATYDRFAGAFIEAAELRGRVEQAAISNLVRDLNRSGLWSKMKAVYPFIGGTASSHKWNLIDPQDTNAAFRLTFSGGWTHGPTGATPNGTNAYADTSMSLNATLAASSTHMSFYSRTSQATATVHEIGCSDNSNEIPNSTLILRYSNGNAIFQTPTYTVGQIQWANSDSKGYYVGSRTSDTYIALHKNGSMVASNTDTNTQATLPTRNCYIGAYHFFSGVGGYSSKECAFATIGNGLTDAEATLLYDAVNRYQKFLGRAV
jgi:hypothetical protein